MPNGVKKGVKCFRAQRVGHMFVKLKGRLWLLLHSSLPIKVKVSRAGRFTYKVPPCFEKKKDPSSFPRLLDQDVIKCLDLDLDKMF